MPALDLRRVHREIEKELIDASIRIITSGRYVLGDEVRRFEKSICEMLGAQDAVAVNSGTDALTLGLMGLGISRDCEVITSPFSFFATAEAILAVQACPVFVDIDPETYCINPAFIERAVTNKTSAIIPVHIFGHPCDMKEICEQAVMLNKVFVLEDCAQAFGAKILGKPVGSFGDFSAFSFYPTKTLGALGDAGCFVANQKGYADAVRILRNHGQSSRYEYLSRGLNSRMDEIQSAFLNVKLKMLEKWNEERRRLSARYTELITSELADSVKCPAEKEGYYHVFHQYAIRVKNRDQVLRYLIDSGIEAIVHYPLPLHLIKPLKFLGYKPGDFPEAEALAREVICLPIFPGLTEEEQQYVVQKLKEAIKRAKGLPGNHQGS